MFNKIDLLRFGLVMIIFSMVAFILPVKNVYAGFGDKIEIEEIVSKHLASIGSNDARVSGRSRIASGISEMRLLTGGRGQSQGITVFASKENSILINADFQSPEYPFERITYDGKDLEVKQYRPGSRSPIGEFFLSYKEIFKEGLFGGVLSTNWALLDLDERKPKLKYKGEEEINGEKVYEIQYKPRKGSDLDIKMYFDAKTFQHLRTKYERTVAAQIGNNPRASASQRGTRFVLEETYSNYTQAGNLTLPKTYTIDYYIFAQNNPIKIQWQFDFSQFAFNQPFDLKESRNN